MVANNVQTTAGRTVTKVGKIHNVVPANRSVNPDHLGSETALREAAHGGVEMSQLPLLNDLKVLIIEELTQALRAEVERQVNKLNLAGLEKYAAQYLAQKVERAIIHKVDKAIDSASLAAASVIMPRLAKQNEHKAGTVATSSTKSNQKNTVTPDILTGLSEGTGEDVPSAANNLMTVGGGGVFTPERSTMPSAEDFAALEPGRENLPTFDMSPKQKQAFAEKMLGQQLAQPPTKEAANSAPGAEAPKGDTDAGAADGGAALNQPTSGVDRLLQLQQNVADADRNFAATGKRSLVEKAQHSQYSTYQHKKHRYHQLLDADRKYRAAKMQQGGQTGTVQQGLARRAMYYMGLGVLERKAEEVGKKIRSNIEHGKFTGFIIALCLALIVDAISIGAAVFDAGTLSGLIMSAVGIFLLIVLGVIILGHGHYFRRWLVKRLFGKAIVRALVTIFSIFVEFTPVGNVVPMWTVQILWMKFDVNKAIREHKADLKHINHDIKKELRRAKHGPINLRKVAKLEAKLNKIQKKAYA